MNRVKRSLRTVRIIVWAGLAVWFAAGSSGYAAHFDNTVSDLSSICYDCHTLNAMLADNNTSFINVSTRTLPTMRSKNGGTAPATFGCTFCHNDPTRTTNMKTAVGPFDARPSQHPVDRIWSKDSFTNVILGANAYTGIYMSNWDNSWARPADQIDCVECHDVNANGGSYPNHPLPATGSRAAGVNPFMLKNTSAMDNIHAPNAFCLATCHAGTASGTSGWKMGHYGWGSFDNAGTLATLKEHDGTPLKSSKCSECHETHSSSVKPDLMGEGKQSAWTVGNTNAYFNPAACTQCHVDTTFLAAGHGKTGINLNCGSCHDPSVSHRDQANPKRLNTTESSTRASLPFPASLGSNGIDDDFDGVIDNPEEAAMQKSGESMCSTTCHSNIHMHSGDIAGTSSSASCFHCHDPHGKGVGTNVKMVRQTVMGRPTTYLTSGTDLYRADNTSICDNPSCHAKPLGSTATPGTILGDVQEHKDAGVGVGTVCTTCHSHSSTTGGASFAPVCNSCHTYPGQYVVSGTHVLSAVHDKHAGLDNTGGYAFACSTCHYKYTHNQSGVLSGSDWNSRFQVANVNIKFNGTWNPKNANGPLYAGAAADNTLADNVYAPGVGGTGTCAGLYCHGNSTTVASWPSGTNTTPVWNDNTTGACGTCHRASVSSPPQTFAHLKHADNTVGYGFSCKKCHYQTTSDGSTITSRSAHLNRQSNVTFDTTDALLSSGAYSGTATVGDSGTTTGTCSNIYCHSPGYRMTAPFDNGALGSPDWKAAGPLACNACHGAAGQAGISVGMPSYANGSPKINTHAKHLADKFACQVCHWATTTTGNTITGRSNHVNGVYNAVNDNVSGHAFTYVTPNCSAAACHGGHTSGSNMPAWGLGPYGCDACHAYTGGVASTSDVDQYTYGSGMAKINADQWNGPVNGSGHGKTLSYASGNPGAGLRFGTCTSNCHATSVSHDNAVNPFRLRTYAGGTDFSDTNKDPGAQQDDNLICLDCHSATGANPTKATRIVEQNHYGTWTGNKHTSSTMGGTFCVDCHDPHGDANHYMIHDNVTQVSDGAYGKPATQAPVARFTKQNLDGAIGLDNVYDWGDYVKSTTPYTGICQTCHASSGGALYFNTGGSGYTSTHNNSGSPPDRCTSCHSHNADFSPTCNACHGESAPTSGAPPVAPTAGNRIWPSTVDNYAVLAGMGNHRSRPASGVNVSSHDAFTAVTAGCTECHTSTPGSGATHNQAGNDNATMSNIGTHNWYTGAIASWSGGALAGAVAGGSVVDDSCANINCHSPYYGTPADQYKSGTPLPYTRYWLNQTLWDCYTCHPYDGRTATSRPAGADNTMSTGSHGRHVGVLQFACSRCHDVTGYSVASFTGNHKNGFVNWSFAGSPNPYPGTPAYSVASGTAAPTDNNAGASHRAWGNCSNLYCHSAGHDNTAAAGYYKSPAWGGAAPVCSGCHGNAAYDNANIRYGMPDALDHANSHAKHVVDNGFECSVCHFLTATGTYLAQSRAILGASNAYHVNGVRDIVFDGTKATGSYNVDNTVQANNKRCDVSCHGTGKPLLQRPQWGGTLANGCFDCHSGTEQIYKPQNDYGTAGTPNPVDNNEYLWSGHGRSGSNYTGSGNLPAGFSNYTAAPVDCYLCHSQNASHTTKDSLDPFRLGVGTDTAGQKGTLKGAFADNTDLLCLGCHGDATQRSGHDNAAKGTGATINARTHARGITGVKYNWPVTPWKCVDCHDPHGDGGSGAERYMMIRSGINAPIDNVDSNAGSDAQSRPKRTGSNVLAVGFNSLSGYSTTAGVYSYANQGNGTTWGPCEVCHTQTTAYSRTADNLGSHATRTNRCTTCHPHKAGFAPTACKGCHGPDGVATAARAPEVGQYWAASGHGRFTTGSPSRPIECEDCHDTSYLTSSDHKTDGSVAGSPPNNINTLGWPGKSPLTADTNPNQNTSHLVAGYIDTAATSREAIARKFDNQCATACHSQDYHRHEMDNIPPGVMRFGDHGTKANPKLFDWYVWDTSTPANYPTSFYQSRSPWVDSDTRTVAGMSDPTVNYGLCVSCHDPHGTGVTDTSGYPGLGTTNHMLRGNWLAPAGPGTFCNNAGCHG